MDFPDGITINNNKYIRDDLILEQAPKLYGMEYKIVRTLSAGVFAGYVESRTGQEVVMRKARRIYHWEGAATLSQLAQSGTSKPKACKFPEEVGKVLLLQAIEILDVTKAAQETIASRGGPGGGGG